MKKVAIFVEGMTEQEFVVSLIANLAGSRGVHVALGRQWRGKVTMRASSPLPTDECFVLVVDCASDDQVKTQIRDQYESLVRAGYTSIIGLRDLYPIPRADTARVEAALGVGLPTTPVAPEIYLAIMEVEAWFLVDVMHFQRIDASLRPEYLAANGFAVDRVSCETWDHPAQILDSIYKLAGSRYLCNDGKKIRRRVMRTLRALNFEYLCGAGRAQSNRMDSFVSAVARLLN